MQTVDHMTGAEGSAAPGRRRAWTRPVVVVVIVVVCLWLATRFVGAIDWAAVGDALSRLRAWQVPVLLAVLLVRQTLNALPLALFIPGLGVGRALRNDLTAHLMVVVTPPPGDIVMRLAMFRSWGIDPARGLAGAMMNMLVFYVNRFTAPVVGLAVLVVLGDGSQRVGAALASGGVALVLAVAVAKLVQGEDMAARVARIAGRLARRLRSSIDPETWAASAVQFQGHVAGQVRTGFPRSLLGLMVMVLADACVLLLALRFVGVSAADIAAYEVIGTFLIAYPLTLPPFMGLGVLDLVLLAAFVEVGGIEIEPDIVAALTVWRATTLLGPILIGLGTTAHWRASVRSA